MFRVEVLGGIASGKTTLARLKTPCVADVLEDFHTNPFWRLFYENPVRYSFQTEITFLLQHFSPLQDAADAKRICIADYSLLLDLAYADINLRSSDRKAFDAVFDRVWEKLGAPSHIVRLQCSENEQLSRIRARGRDVESGISLSYLTELSGAIERRFSDYSCGSQVLEIDSETYNFATDASKIAETRKLLEAFIQGF